MTNSISLKIQNLSFKYENDVVFDDFSLEITNKVIGVMGPSGCGKTTLLRLIANLEEPDLGLIKHSGRDSKKQIKIAYLFQDYDAYPWMTVHENVYFSSQNKSSDEIDSLLKNVNLKNQKDKYPSELSGGMRKRLALAKNLISNPDVILLDEPFSSLDFYLKLEMYKLVQDFVQDYKGIMLIVTHDPTEAQMLCDEILIISSKGYVTKKIEVSHPRPRTKELLGSNQFHEIEKRIYDGLN